MTVFPPLQGRVTHWRSRAFLGGVGYVCLLFVASLLARIPLDLGPSLLGTGLPIVVSSALGVALVGAFVTALTGFGLRFPAVLAGVAVPVAVLAEASSLSPSFASLLGFWPTLAPLVVSVAAIEYGIRRGSRPGERGGRRSRSTERALLGGTLAACCVLLAFSLRGVGPLTMLSPTGSFPSPSTLAGVLAAFGPPALLVGASATLVARYGLITPFVSVPVVGTLLASPLGIAFSLFTAASPLVFVAVLVLAAGEYSLRVRLSSFRPRSLVG